MNFLNNTFVTLSAGISSSDRVIFAKNFVGNLGSNFPITAVIAESDDAGKVIKREIIRITGRNDTMLNIDRAVESCPQSDDAESQTNNALNFSENAIVYHALTAGDLSKIVGKIDEKLSKSELRTGLSQGLILADESGNEIITTEIPQYLKNQFSGGQKYILGEDLPSVVNKTFSNTLIGQGNLAYVLDNSNTLGDIFFGPGKFRDRGIYIATAELNKPINITKIIFNHQMHVKVEFINSNGVSSIIYNGGYNTMYNQNKVNQVVNATDVKKIKVTVDCQGTSSNGVGMSEIRFDFNYNESSVFALTEIKKQKILFKNLNSENTNSDKVGFKMQFPTNVKLKRIRTSGKPNSSGKVFLMKNTEIVKEFSPISAGSKVFDLEGTVLEKNIEYSLVLNNSGNFENNASYINLNEAKKYFKYITTGTNNSQNTDKIAGFEFMEIDYGNKLFLASDILAKSGFGDVIGFMGSPFREGDEITLLKTETIDYLGAKKGKIYKLSHRGLISEVTFNEDENPIFIGKAIEDNLIKLENNFIKKTFSKQFSIENSKKYYIEINEPGIITLQLSNLGVNQEARYSDICKNNEIIKLEENDDNVYINVDAGDFIFFTVRNNVRYAYGYNNPTLNISFKGYVKNNNNDPIVIY